MVDTEKKIEMKNKGYKLKFGWGKDSFSLRNSNGEKIYFKQGVVYFKTVKDSDGNDVEGNEYKLISSMSSQLRKKFFDEI